MPLDVALVGYPTQNGAVNAFTERTGADSPWTNEVAFVEHHHNGRVTISGSFLGHYVDVNEEDRLSQAGAAEGALTGVLVGFVFGPPGWAAGFVLGGAIGGEVATPTEVEAEPPGVADQLRGGVPTGGSAVVLVAVPDHVDAMVEALKDTGGQVTRRTLSAEEETALQSALSGEPAARVGPIEPGDEQRPVPEQRP
jgi:uncharacterized membrane protein